MDIVEQLKKISALMAEKSKIQDKLAIERQALAVVACPHAVGDIVIIPQDGTSFKRGHKMRITSIDYDYPRNRSMPAQELAWVVHGNVLNKDGSTSEFRSGFHQTMEDYLASILPTI